MALKKKKKRKAGAGTPPPGTYDPALDQANAAAQRGYGDLQADFTRDFGAGGTGGRMFNDYQHALQQIALGRTRSTEDRDSALGNVALGYQRLGRQQAEQGRQFGDMSQGLVQQQAGVRAANKTRDEQPILTSFSRAMQDFDTDQGQVGLGYQRSLTDAQTALSRAGRETGQFGVDTAESRLHQATQYGWSPPKPPRRRRQRWSAPGPRSTGHSMVGV